MAYTFKIKLDGTAKPPVWRKIKINANDTFFSLHLAIQAAFGWENYHLWQFAETTGTQPVIIAEPDEDDDLAFAEQFLPPGRPRYKRLDAAATPLSEYFDEAGKKMTYTYDFGDNWEHTVELTAEDEVTVLFPICTGGKGQCPPEDCGGIWGYRELAETLNNPKSPGYRDARSWLGLKRGETWDVNEFSPEETNRRMEEWFTP